MKILIIEDEYDIREALTDWLMFEGYETFKASNGRAGIDLATQELPDLIISDISMPEMDGYRVLAELRTNPQTALIPLIFLTAHSRKEDIRQGMELGAEDYLTKPFTNEMVLRAVKTQLNKSQKLREHSQVELETLRANLTHTLPHELRTPLTGILGFASLLSMDGETMEGAQVKQMAEAILESGQRLHHLIENYLLYADIELTAASSAETAPYQTSWASHADQFVAKAAEKATYLYERSNDLHLDLQGEGCAVRITEVDLEKLVGELVNNSCKFSQAGNQVKVSSRFTADGTYHLSVTDKGKGMRPEDVQRIGAYRQFGRTVYEQQGVGLGLIIAKRLTELYGGQFDVTSEPFVQTTITAHLVAEAI